MKAPLLLVLGLFSLASLAHADRREQDGRRSGPRVILYEHAGFSGGAVVLYPGEAIENMSGETFENGAKLNDRVTSIWIEGDVEVYAYENANFRGEALRLMENVRDLSGRLIPGSVSASWNDRISSIRVERARGGRDRDRDHGRDDNRGGFKGNPEKAIRDAFKDILGREPDGQELGYFRTRLLDLGWNERMLRDHLRGEENYRIEAADLIIRRAYRDVLDRDPDPSGLKTYRRNLLDRKWTEGDVRDDLRKSEEFRRRGK